MEGELLAFELSDAIAASKNMNDNTKIKDLLNKIIAEGKDYKIDIFDSLTLLLATDDEEIQCLVTQTIAEQSICEEKRKIYSQDNIITTLLQFLKTPMEEKNLKLIKQTCRALGNICCDNFIGRDLILNLGGTSLIVELLPKTMQNLECSKSEYTSVRLCVCKLLLNLLLGGSTYIEAALDANIIQHMDDVLRFESEERNEECLSMLLLVVSVILDNKPSIVLEKKFNTLVVDILKDTESIEISEMCLEHLHAQAEHDEVKNTLAKAKVPQLLWGLLQEHSSLAVNEEKRAVMKLACDLIVLILTGDDSMHHLYGEGTGEVYLAMVKWLDAADLDLVTTAVLALGNFARTDTHCLHMMDSGVFAKLLSILSSHKSSEDDIRLQHAVLSTLRNLVVPQQNKPLAIQKGMLPVLTEMLPNITQYHVVFKLLASLRMLVDKQEAVAVQLVSCGMLEQVAHWAGRWEHPGVTGEAQRLLAWSIRQLHSTDALSKVVQVEGCVTCLVTMLVGTHVIMQNEAIISLTILCTVYLDGDNSSDKDNNKICDTDTQICSDTSEISSTANKLIGELIKADIGKQLKTMIENNLNVLQLEVLENICKFITVLIKNCDLCLHLHQQDVHGALNKCITERDDLQELLKKSIENVMNEVKCMNACELHAE